MEKKKYTMQPADMEEVKECSIGDEIIHVRLRIPLEQKVEMATELGNMLAVPYEDIGFMSQSALYEVCLLYLIMKYYTDVDLEDVEARVLFDWVVSCDANAKIRSMIYNDLVYVTDMTHRMMENLKAEYEKRNGLAHAIKTTFSFLFNGEDITETLAKSQAVSDQMIEVVGKLNEANRKPDVGKVKVSGNVINIGKKK